MRKVTIHEIARTLGISSATVSRALNNKDARVSEKTREKVKKMAEKLGYQQNTIASSLRKGNSNIVGIIVPFIDRDFFSSLIRGVEEELKTEGYSLLICQSYDKPENEAEEINTLLSARVSGILMSPTRRTDPEDLRALMGKGTPIIIFDRIIKELPTSSVGIDDFHASYSVTDHLIKQGRKKIALLTRNQAVGIFRERQRGYLAALQDYGIKPDNNYLVPITGFREDGVRAAIQLMSLPNPPDAICSVSDLSAFGAMQWLLQNGYKVPQDISIAGFGNDQFTAFITPAMTSVDQKSTEMGKIAAQLFFKQRAEPTYEPRKVLLSAELIIRESSVAGASTETVTELKPTL